MFVNSQETLFIVLTIAILLLTIFLCVTLIYLILILRDFSKVMGKARVTVDSVNAFIMKPVSLASAIVDRIRPMIEAAMEPDEKDEEPRKKGKRQK